MKILKYKLILGLLLNSMPNIAMQEHACKDIYQIIEQHESNIDFISHPLNITNNLDNNLDDLSDLDDLDVQIDLEDIDSNQNSDYTSEREEDDDSDSDYQTDSQFEFDYSYNNQNNQEDNPAIINVHNRSNYDINKIGNYKAVLTLITISTGAITSFIIYKTKTKRKNTQKEHSHTKNKEKSY